MRLGNMLTRLGCVGLAIVAASFYYTAPLRLLRDMKNICFAEAHLANAYIETHVDLDSVNQRLAGALGEASHGKLNADSFAELIRQGALSSQFEQRKSDNIAYAGPDTMRRNEKLMSRSTITAWRFLSVTRAKVILWHGLGEPDGWELVFIARKDGLLDGWKIVQVSQFRQLAEQ